MNSYEKTVVDGKPEYVGQRLLLVEAEKKRLLKTKEGNFVEVIIGSNGELSVNKIFGNGKRKEWDIPSLRHLGIDLYGFKDPSVSQMLGLLVLPLMEVERIFNALKYKYLQSVYESYLAPPPGDFFSSHYNDAFKALAGFPVYQGGTKIRKHNDKFYLDEGFKTPSDTGITFEKEKENLNFILKYLRELPKRDYGQIYLELIGIKPGFHELWIHEDYFDFDGYPKSDEARDIALAFFRGIGDGHKFHLSQLPTNIKKNTYFTYAACAITEGPFVFRKNLSVSYYESLRRITKASDKKKLCGEFYIYDFKNKKIDTRQELVELLKETESYMTFSPSSYWNGCCP